MDSLGQLIAAVAASGALGLFGISVLERLLPVLPSYALLVAIGIASSLGYWALPTALVTSVSGGLLGSLCCYALGSALGERRGLRLLGCAAAALGVSRSRFESVARGLRASGVPLAFAAQMVPTVRFVSPAIAGCMRVEPRVFLFGTALGVLIWNSLFITVGYGIGAHAGLADASQIALKTLLALLVVEILLVAAWRLRRHERAAALEAGNG